MRTATFDLGLVARLAHARREHREAVVLREILIGAIDAGLVARRLGDPGLQIVADNRLRHAADRGQGVDMRTDPIGKPFRPARLGVGVVGCAERRDEDVGGTLRAICLIKHRHRVAGIIDEQLLPGRMRLPHRRRDRFAPFAIEIAEAAVTVAVRLLRAVLLPQQHQRHAAPLHLLVDLAPIDRRTRRTRLARNRKQPPLELGVVDLLGHRPGDADHAGSAHVLPDHRLADARRLADLPQAHPKRVLEPQHVTHFAHRQSLRWHREPRSVAGSLITRFDRRRERRSARPHRLSAIIGTLSGLRRNPVRNPSDSAAGLSTSLTQSRAYRRTICSVVARDYLLRRINGVLEPIIRHTFWGGTSVALAYRRTCPRSAPGD